MTYKITHKNSTVSGTPPTAGDIDVGEIAINAADAELYTKDTAGNIKKFANTDTTSAADGVNFTQAGTGAVERTVESKLQDVVSVKDFGAVGDGVADDTVAIQAAINSGAKLITAPAGRVFRITNTIALNVAGKPVIDFNKSELSLDDPSGLKSHIKIGDGITQRSVIIKNVTFVRAQVATSGFAIDSDFFGVSEIYGCRIYGNNEIHGGIRVYRGIQIDIRNNYIDNCVGHAMYLQGSGLGANRTVDVYIRENRVDGCATSLTTYDFVEGLFARDNIFFNPVGAAVALNASSNANGLGSFKLQENDYDTCGTVGVYIDNVSNIQITDCWFSNNSATDLILADNVDGCVVAGNQFYPASMSIEVKGDNVVVDNNMVLGSGVGTLVALNSAASTFTVSNNLLTQCQYAINLGSATNGLITGNRFASVSSGTAITGNSGSNTVIEGNAGDSARGAIGGITVGASPFTYTAGARPECLYISGGTVSSIFIGGGGVFFSSDKTITLAPYQSVVVTYSSVPFMQRSFV